MSYTTQDFKDGDVLYAAQMMAIDNALLDHEKRLSEIETWLNSRPQIISVTPDKTNIIVGESVTFSVKQKNAASIRFIVDDAVNERIYDVNQETITFTKKFLTSGENGLRTVAFQAVDSAGNLGAESTAIVITIQEGS